MIEWPKQARRRHSRRADVTRQCRHSFRVPIGAGVEAGLVLFGRSCKTRPEIRPNSPIHRREFVVVFIEVTDGVGYRTRSMLVMTTRMEL